MVRDGEQQQWSASDSHSPSVSLSPSEPNKKRKKKTRAEIERVGERGTRGTTAVLGFENESPRR